MGTRGPAPKRSDQRRRTNSAAPQKAPAGSEPTPPSADPEWHPVARQWFESLVGSGQSRFYEPSDWAAAVVLAESISREFKPQPFTVGKGDDAHFEMVEMAPKGASLAAWLKGMAALMVTEGERRRAGLELQRGPVGVEEVGDVSELDEYRDRLRGSAG